jgi:hypothetical protein
MVSGQLTPTRAVIVVFVDCLPETVSIGLVDFQVQTYIPQPMRSSKCHKYGHKVIRCNQETVTCPKCSQHHDAKYCQVKEREMIKCANCGHAHSAAYKVCSKYQQVSKTLILAAKTNISYRDAAMAFGKKAREEKQVSRARTTQPADPTATTPVGTGEPITSHPAEGSAVGTSVQTHTERRTVESSTQTDSVVEVAAQTEPVTESEAAPLADMLQHLVKIVHFLMNTVPATDRNAKPHHDAMTVVMEVVAKVRDKGNRQRCGSEPTARVAPATVPADVWTERTA